MKNVLLRHLTCLFGVIFTFAFTPVLQAQFTITDNFKGSTVGSNIIMGGNPSSTLTSGVVDPVNDGWLRLTKATGNQKGYAYISSSFPSTLGVLFDFEYKTWRDVADNTYNGADGFCVFFFDATATFALGGYGGSLGYAPNTVAGTTTGLAGGYIGVGFDEYGNFSNPTEGRNGGIAGLSPNSITLRGPTTSDPLTTNPYLTSTQLQTSSSADGITSVDYNTVTATRPTDAQFYRRVKISIMPSGSQYIITVMWRTSPAGADVTLLTYTTTTPPPANLKVGFAASTGGGFNYHEIRNRTITTPGNVRVDKTVDKANAKIGDQLTYTVNVTNDTPAPITNLALSDILKDGSGNNITLGSSFTLNSITFNNNGNAGNTATGFPNGTAVTTGFTNPLNFSLNMAANSVASFTIVGTVNNVPAGGDLVNTATVDPTPTGITDQDLTNNTYTVSTNILTPNIDFVIDKGVNNSCADPTNGNTYTLLVTNNGSDPSVRNKTVTVTDVIPTGFTVTAASGTNWTATSSGNTYTFTRSDVLKSTFSYEPITISVKPPSTTGTSWTNSATVAYAGTEANTTNNTSQSVILYSKPTAPTVSSPVSYCKGNTAAALTATGTNLLWYTAAAGTGSSTAPVPTTATTGSTTYYVTQSSGSCESAQTPLVVNVNPVPAVTNTTLSQTICSGSTSAAVALTSDISGAAFAWTASGTAGVSGFTASGSTSTIPAQTIINSGATTGTVTYTIIPTATGCSGAPVNYTITVNPATVGGTVSSAQTICYNATPTDLTLSGNVGSVVKWQKSTDAAFTSPIDISATTTTLSSATIGALTASTYFRAVVQSGVCSTANSGSALITVNPATVGGTVSSAQTICYNATPTDLTLSGNVGSVVKWQKSTDAAFTSPIDISATTTTLSSATIGALTASTYFRAVVQSGVCSTANSGSALITVNPATVGGTVSSAQTICYNATPTDLTLSGNVGSVVKWQKSTDAAFTSPIDIAATTTTLSSATIGALTANTYFRAVVQSGVCSTANSGSALITVNPATVGGTVSSAQTICYNATPTDLTLSGNVGSVVKWQKSTDAAFTSPIDISATTTTLSSATIGALTANTYFRAVVQSGVCSTANSGSALITVNPATVGGTVSSAQTICYNATPTDLTLSGNVGSVVKWQKSTDAAFTSPIDISATTTTLSSAAIGALTANTYFRAVVQSGVCSTANSGSALITVNPATVGGTVSSAQTICYNATPTDLTLSGNVGSVVKWQKSTDAAFTSPIDISATTTTLSSATIGALTANTYFRAVVQSGVCSTANSGSALITVNPATVGGTVSSAQTICYNATPTDLTLTGNVGSVVKWQKSTDAAFTSPIDISATTTTLSSATIGALTANTYFRAVVQSGVCNQLYSNGVLISVPTSVLSATATETAHTKCNGGATGEITVTANNGWGGYSYSKDGGVNWQTNKVFSGLTEGNYSIIVKDIGGCTTITSATVSPFNAPVVSAQAAVCVGSTIILSPAVGGSWISNNPTVASVTNEGVVTGLVAGSTTFTFTSSTTDCSATTSNVTVNALPTISGAADVYAGATITFTGSPIAATTNAWVSGNTAVASIDNAGVVQGIKAGSSTITYTNNEGCQASASITVVASADLQMDKKVDNLSPKVGDKVTFTLTVKNNGPSDATGVKVRDVLPSGYSFVSVSPSGVYDSATGVWNIGVLLNGNSTSLTVEAIVQ